MSVAGIWTNEYGSRMELWAQDDGVILGRYASTTGSTGEYALRGHAGPLAATPAAGQPLALAICWHSIVPGPADPSWEWCSGLSGQISLRDGVPEMVLTHALVASSAFPGLVEAGTLIDRLTYRRVGEAGAPPPAPAAQEIASPLSGIWTDGEGMRVDLRSASAAGYDLVDGISGRSGKEWAVTGFAGRGAVRSLALTTRLSDGSVTAYAGTLSSGSDGLSLIELSSHATSPDSTYLQTRVNGRRWQRG